MPLTRYRIKNEYGLADPETYRSADKEDPEALLEGVAMAGLVGLLRQLGDLAEFAAEIFHDLHEEVMATAARGHGLTVRIQQLEAEFPPIEKALLLQTNHSSYYSNLGVEWHPNLQMEQNLIARGDLPRFVMDSYEESRGPPRLFLLDKFDVAGAGACLKRYTDPSFFKVETVSDNLPTMEVQREKKVRKTKKKGSRWRNGETPETVPASHAKLHQLFLEERIENAYSDPARRVKLKRRPLNESPFDSKCRKSYMEKFVETPSPESKTICEVSLVPLSLEWTQDDTSEQGLEVVEVSTISPVKDMSQANDRDVSSPLTQGKQLMDDLEYLQPTINGEIDEVSSISHAAVEEKKLIVNGDREGSVDGYHSDEMTSEVENYMDALAAIESDDGNSSYERNSSSLCTDGLSNMGDSSQFDGYRFSRVLPSPENTVTYSGNMPDDQLLPMKEAFDMESKELTVATATGVEDDAVCDPGEASQASSSANLESAFTPINGGCGSPMGSEQDEASSDRIKHATGLSDADKTMEVDSTPQDSDELPNQMDGNTLAAVTTKSLPLDELEDGHFRDCSMDTEHSSGDLEVASESESRNKMLNAEDVESYDGKLLRLSLEEHHQFSPHTGEDGSVDHAISSASSPRDSDAEQVSAISDEVTAAMLAPVVDLEKPTVSADERQIHAEDHTLLDEVVNEGNLSDLDLQREGGDHESSRTLDGANIDSFTYNVVEDGRESGPPIHLDVPYAGNDVCSNSGDHMLPRVSLEETTALVDASHVLVKEEQFMGETQKLILHEGNQPEVDVQNEERSHRGITQAGENADSRTCIVEGADGLTVPLVPPGSDNSMLDDLVKRDVQAVDVGNSQSAVADIGGVPQETLNIYEAEDSSWMKESGVKENVNGVGVAYADLDSISAADWDPMAYDHNSTAVGASGSSLSEQTQSDFCHDIGAPPMDSEIENSKHVLLRMENALPSRGGFPVVSIAALEESSKLMVDEPAVDLHLADNDTPFQVDRVTSLDHLDQVTAFKSEEYNSGLQEQAHDTDLQQVTGATQLPGSEDEDVQSPYSMHQEKQGGSSAKMLDSFSIQQPSLSAFLQGSEFNTGVDNFGLLSEDGKVNPPEMPPLPPLPPVQWRMGKALNAPSTPERKFPGFGLGLFPMSQPSIPEENAQIGFPSLRAGFQLSDTPFLSSPMGSETENPGQPYAYALQMPPVDRDSGTHSNDMEVKPLPGSLWPEHTSNEPSEQHSLASDTELMQVSPSSQSLGVSSEQHPGSPPDELAQTQDQSLLETDKEAKDLQHINEDADGHDCSDLAKTMQEQQNPLNSEEERVGSIDPWASPPTNEGRKPNGTLIGNIPRPPKPLIEAVAAHDRSKLRKVTERVRPQLAPKLEERDSLLEQIRTKSFNLKPAPVTRPSIQQGPRTNLKVAAILEKANAIRQALAGSDEDDDADSWSE